MFNVGQRAAVAAAFKLAGYEGPLLVGPIRSGDERVFLLERRDFQGLRDVRALDQVLSQLLGCKAWVVEHDGRWGSPRPFQ